MEKITHIAIVSSPGFSLLFPSLEFSKRLVRLHQDFHVTCIIPTLGSPPTIPKAYLETLPPNIDLVFLPQVNQEDLPEGAPTPVRIQLTVTRSLPSLREALKSLTSKAPLAALVAVPFAFEALEFAKEFNTLSFLYFPSGAMSLASFFYLPKLDETVSGEYRDLTDPIQVPGCIQINARDLPDPIQNRSGQAYKLFLEIGKRIQFVDGILVNSFLDMESGPIRAMTEDGSGYPPVYPVGPITETGSTSPTERSDCLRWLDKQPTHSVLYVCFGSGGTLSQEQINELAFGLELSGKSFLWVVRAPSNSASAAYLDAAIEDPLKFLPAGFLERTKEQGLVIPLWVPQVEVLSHRAVGGFLSHCGWNSTLESVKLGVPLITWPLFAEQRMNAALLTDGLKVALRPKANENGIVEREEVAKVVQSLIGGEEGKGIRERIEDLKEAAANALEEDGSSTKTLSDVALRWKLSAFHKLKWTHSMVYI